MYTYPSYHTSTKHTASSSVSTDSQQPPFSIPETNSPRGDQFPKTPNGVIGLRPSPAQKGELIQSFMREAKTFEYTALFFSNLGLSSTDMHHLFRHLQSNTSVQHVILSQNPVLSDVASQSQFAVAALADLLKVNHHIGWLVLNKTAIGDVGLSTIADALKENSGVKHVVLADNDIGDLGVSALSDMLGHNTSIQSLFLQGNSRIGSAGIQSLINALKNGHPSLKTLDIRDIGHVDIRHQSELQLLADRHDIRLLS